MPRRTRNKDLSALLHEEEPQAETRPAAPGAPADESARRAARIVGVPLSRVLPDRFQSRVILPPELKAAFFAGRLDCYGVGQQLFVAADGDPALRRQIDDLLVLGTSILDDGQVEPATGTWVRTPAGDRFLLEAGERRFWSLVLKSQELAGPDELRLQAVEQQGASRLRQIAENLAREDLSAVDFAKAVASLILELMNVHPDANESEYEYFHRALESRRLPSGTWPKIERLTGLDRSYLYRHLQILSLDEELLYLASLYRINEARLREIVAAPPERQRALMFAAIDEQLTASELAEAAVAVSPPGEQPPARAPSNNKDPYRRAASRMKSVLRLISGPASRLDFDRVANEFSALLQDPADLDAAADSLEQLAESIRRAGRRRK
jgi:hypothetical protein